MSQEPVVIVICSFKLLLFALIFILIPPSFAVVSLATTTLHLNSHFAGATVFVTKSNFVMFVTVEELLQIHSKDIM